MTDLGLEAKLMGLAINSSHSSIPESLRGYKAGALEVGLISCQNL